jgi:glycosyltransferase involved in cell wall biosynthesis
MPRIALICDFVEEGWSSMDLVGVMLERGLKECGGGLRVERLCPPMRRRLSRANRPGPSALFNADRVLNRFWDYPRRLRTVRQTFDLFHIVDHSYSQLVHELPADRTIISCHDVDTFRCLLEPEQEKRSPVFRAMTRRILGGFQKAAWVTCASGATMNAILVNRLVPESRLSVVPNGVHPAYFPDPGPRAEKEAGRLLGPASGLDVLHVGSTIPRKRIDVLLHVFARVRQQFAEARLVRVGGPFTAEQAALADSLGLAGWVVVLPRLETSVLGAVYRRCSVALVPSEREGFGLPLAESMACGTPVIASDLPALREVGGPAAEYCPPGELDAWTAATIRLLRERTGDRDAWDRRRRRCVEQAAQYTWTEYARRMTGIYSKLLAA